ncbi:unnamed protein product [Anisakis simplex]|uniref:FMN_red domain-containing protein n=1 Tax=Anisakis simplex TaxID=6269 RepID=A0A0M3KKQ7_ANISI|nr:unnamed protein product [Anisakis simplex]
MCRQKYGADFCRKMKMACFELMRVAVPMFANGTTNIVQLPQSVVICISSGG